MAEKKNYECADCGNQAATDAEGAQIPECCGKKMQAQEPLQVCVTPSSSEHSRFDDPGEPCDDGRSGS